MDLVYCGGHEGAVWHWRSEKCPACLEEQFYRKKYAEQNRQLKRDLKLAKLEKMEERQKRLHIQHEAREYFATKKKVDDYTDGKL